MTTADSRNGLLRLIAVFKVIKAVTLIVLGLSALRLIHGDAVETLTHWLAHAGLRPGERYVDEALSKVASLPPSRFKELGAGSFVYAALFLTEGAGLWLRKRWAEWFTVLITGSLVPVEFYELHRHPTIAKALLLLLNIAVVWYLLSRLRRERALRG